MKNMKKLSGLIAFVCVLLSVLLLACACTGEQAKEQETTETTGTNPVEKPTETPTETPTTENPDKPNPPDDGKVTYTVTVLGEDGKKLEGVSVQMCDDAGCKLPTATNAEGVVTFRYAPSNYHVTILSAPEGYIVDSQAQYYFTDNALKILLKKAPATLTYKVEVLTTRALCWRALRLPFPTLSETLPTLRQMPTVSQPSRLPRQITA
ncbi:MAG: hypothetical protein IJF33_03110, partial [Clostridia bacterium]|nr:hypothetical protein [Clostridia bacterium]